MSLFKDWNSKLENIKNEAQYKEFWDEYIIKETNCYKSILASKTAKIEGTIKELSEKYNLTCEQFVGFLDGANTSFVEELSLEDLTEESVLKAEFDFEKLLWNMHEVKADWLFTLDEWINIFDADEQKEIAKKFNRSKMAVSKKVGRNDPCPCGSGKKYKKCCGK